LLSTIPINSPSGKRSCISVNIFVPSNLPKQHSFLSAKFDPCPQLMALQSLGFHDHSWQQ
jgi:hypothetical protein